MNPPSAGSSVHVRQVSVTRMETYVAFHQIDFCYSRNLLFLYFHFIFNARLDWIRNQSINVSFGPALRRTADARVCLARFDGNNSSGAVDGNIPSMQCIAASFSDRCNLLPVPAIQWETRVHVFEKRYG